MLQSITNLFKRDSHFQKSLKATSILNDVETVNINDIRDMLQGFEANDSNNDFYDVNTQEVIKAFFKYLPQDPPNRIKIKILITCHVLMGDYNKGEEFSSVFAQWPGWNIKENDKIELKLIKQYYQFLQRLAHNYSILQMSKLRTYPQNPSQSIVIYFKLINILNFLFSLRDVLCEILTKNQSYQLYQEVYLLIWNDSIAMYLFFEQMVFDFLADYSKLGARDFKTIYDLLPDFLRCTSQIKEVYKLKDIFDKDNTLLAIKWKQINRKQLEDLKHYFDNLKIQTHREKIEKSQSPPSHLSSRMSGHGSPHMRKSPSFKNKTCSSPLHERLTTLTYAKRLSTADHPQEIFGEEIQFSRNRRFNFQNFMS